LNPDARAAIELTDLEEQSNAEVALQLGITVAALKTRKVRGRASLRRKLLQSKGNSTHEHSN
jgi:DNA-directed RNA polymerase specialized sigma24 family protein